MTRTARNGFTTIILAALCIFTGCSSPKGSSLTEKRSSVMQMRNEVMAELSKQNPQIQSRAMSAPGYAVFSNYGLKILVAGGGNGYGVAHNNKTGQDTYMRMGELNAGLGFGAKDFRVLFVFNTEQAMRRFVEEGWDVGGDAEAGGKFKNEGLEAGKSVSVGDIDIYQFTKSGATLQATVGATKYWKDKELNAGS